MELSLQNLFVYCSTLDKFNTLKVSTDASNESYSISETGVTIFGAPEVLWENIVFIEDEHLIWTHGVFYNQADTKYSVLNYAEVIELEEESRSFFTINDVNTPILLNYSEILYCSINDWYLESGQFDRVSEYCLFNNQEGEQKYVYLYFTKNNGIYVLSGVLIYNKGAISSYTYHKDASLGTVYRTSANGIIAEEMKRFPEEFSPHNTDAIEKVIAAALNDHEGRILDLSTSISTIETQISGMQTANLDASIKALDSSLKALDSSVKTIYPEIKIIDASISLLDSSVKTLDSSVKTINNEIKVIDASISLIDSSIQTIDAYIAILDTSIAQKQDILTAGTDIDITDDVISVVEEWNTAVFDTAAFKTGSLTITTPTGYVFDKLYILCHWYGTAAAVATTIYGGFYEGTNTDASKQVLRNNGTNKMGAGYITANVVNMDDNSAIAYGEAYLYNNNGTATTLNNPINSYGIGRYSHSNDFTHFTIHNYPSGITEGYCCIKYKLKKQ